MRRGLVVAAVLVQAVIVFGMIFIAMEPLRSGRDVTVTVTGLDPRDLMRGQYVDLVYSFSMIDLASVDCQLDRYATYHYGDVVYVSLSDDTEPRATRIALEPPADGLFLRGRLVERFSGSPIEGMGVQYGIESYYTNPDRANELDSILTRSGSLRVHLKVDADGDARIDEVEVVP